VVTTTVYAHSLGSYLAAWEPLARHLHEVSEAAAVNATRFGYAKLAGTAGLLHDIGKASEQFQAYIRSEAPSGGDHATAGAREAIEAYSRFGRMLALVIAGHHSGLLDAATLDRRLAAILPDYTGWQEFTGPLPSQADLAQTIRTPKSTYIGASPAFSLSFLVRMVFSSLVDADFIATESFMQGRPLTRGTTTAIPVLLDRLDAHLASKRDTSTPLNALRADILDHAVSRVGDAPGFFTLTVPTGGGKTLTSLAFALAHAARHGKRRVVVVIPFTAIIEQTAQVYRDILGADAVLEHHSSFDWEDTVRAPGDGGTERDGLGSLRRAAENWDAPVIVTTAVQFFESLFASRTSRCRKLHNLADNVIILDEAQATPPHVLLPCLAVLEELRRGYGASMVLCTATQPAWRAMDEALVFSNQGGDTINYGLDIGPERELAPRPPELYTALRRTQVEISPDPVQDATIADAFARAPQMLCIVNSRAHARDLFERIRGQEGATHLTTLMCAAHRREVLAHVKQRLRDHFPVRLVATSLIEAGVDISFPEVWRASAGLDAIAQAAGRCNREGELQPALGRVVVFTPADAKPPAALRVFQQAARPILRDAADPLGLDAVGDYFRLLYSHRGLASLDSTIAGGVLKAIDEGGQGLLFPYETIAEAFKLIDEAMRPVIIPFNKRARQSLADLTAGRVGIGPALRALQPYVVGIPERARADWLARKILAPVRPELGESVLQLTDLTPSYSPATGLDLTDGAYRTAEENIW
jgi:CRISPR-associated endonuclease/helicase Cas3